MSSTAPDVEYHPRRKTDTRFQFGLPIGVDVGRRRLLTLAPATAGPDLDEALIIGNRNVEDYYAKLQQRYESGERDAVDWALTQQLDTVLDAAAHEALEYAQSFNAPAMLVIEDLSYTQRSLADCVADGAGPDCWLLPGIQQRLTQLARADGVPIAITTEEHSTKECHACGEHSKVRDETIRCTNDACPVETACRDRSAAATIAKRLG